MTRCDGLHLPFAFLLIQLLISVYEDERVRLERLVALLEEAQQVYRKRNLQGRLPQPDWAGILGMQLGADLDAAHSRARRLLYQLEFHRRISFPSSAVESKHV